MPGVYPARDSASELRRANPIVGTQAAPFEGMKTIVVGLDASPRSPAVLRSALVLAERFGARLFIVRAAALPPEIPAEALTASPDSLPVRLAEITQSGLDRAIANVPSGVLLGAEARIGSGWQVICDAASEKNADLVVVGTHGYSGLDRVLGTTAAKVVNHAPCSVFVVREEIEP
jgi:nucleotide-binding universal stress UspA family protein